AAAVEVAAPTVCREPGCTPGDIQSTARSAAGRSGTSSLSHALAHLIDDTPSCFELALQLEDAGSALLRRLLGSQCAKLGRKRIDAPLCLGAITAHGAAGSVLKTTMVRIPATR